MTISKKLAKLYRNFSLVKLTFLTLTSSKRKGIKFLTILTKNLFPYRSPSNWIHRISHIYDWKTSEREKNRKKRRKIDTNLGERQKRE